MEYLDSTQQIRAGPQQGCARLNGWASAFALDVRSLSLFRIVLGILVVVDLLTRARTLTSHYTDAGVLPRSVIEPLLPEPRLFSLFFLSGETWVQGVFIACGIACALSLVLGYRTRLVTCATLYVLVSIQMRNPLACHTGDAYLNNLLFWSCFLPIANRWSLDARAGRQRDSAALNVSNLATAAMLLQVALFYGMAGLLKSGHEVWSSGNALSVFLGIEQYGTAFGATLLEHPALTEALTYGTIVLELVAPLLLLLPFWGHTPRLFVIALLLGFHLGIQLSIHIGIFQWTALAALLALVPSRVWLSGTGSRLQAGLDRCLGEPRDEASLFRISRVSKTLLFFALVLVLWSNAQSASGRHTRLPFPFAGPVFSLNLQQRWAVFTAIDGVRQGWFRAIGRTTTGGRVDILTGAETVNDAPPEDPSAMFVNHNDRRYWTQLALERHRGLRPGLSEDLCRRWASEHPGKLTHVAIFQVGKLPSETQLRPKLLIEHRCGQSSTDDDQVTAQPERRGR